MKRGWLITCGIFLVLSVFIFLAAVSDGGNIRAMNTSEIIPTIFIALPLTFLSFYFIRAGVKKIEHNRILNTGATLSLIGSSILFILTVIALIRDTFYNTSQQIGNILFVLIGVAILLLLNAVSLVLVIIDYFKSRRSGTK